MDKRILLYFYNSPLGKMTMSSDGNALTGLWFEGQKYFGADFPKESIYPIIYTLSERNELYVHLDKVLKIATINPILKAKLGKKKLYKTEELTADYIKKLMIPLQLEINGLKKKLEDFNSKAELDIDKAYMYLAA